MNIRHFLYYGEVLNTVLSSRYFTGMCAIIIYCHTTASVPPMRVSALLSLRKKGDNKGQLVDFVMVHMKSGLHILIF